MRDHKTRSVTRAPADAPPAMTRMDTHVHTRASDKPVIPAAGLIDAAECYTEPEHAYDQARARGMDLVTITDHDTINGALELHERGFERFVIGEEVSTRFPEDGCVLHVLVWRLSPLEHEQIEALGLRGDVYEFAAWLRERDLPHSLAHPLYAQNGRLSRRHIEIATLLFRCFESLSGAHLGVHRGVLGRYLESLTSERIAAMTRRYGIEPVWPHAGDKGRTGGSDDHGLINIGRTWTSVRGGGGEKITDPAEFFGMVMSGRCEAGGEAGRSEHLAHQIAAVAARYAQRRLGRRTNPLGRAVASKLGRFAGVAIEPPSRVLLVGRALRRKLRRRPGRERPIVQALRETLKPVLQRYPDLRARLDPVRWIEGPALGEHERMAEFTDELTAAIGRAMARPALDALRERDLRRAREYGDSYLLLLAAQLPDIAAMFVQNKDRRFVERFAHELEGAGLSPLDRPMRLMVFTDTLGDVNGVCRFIQDTASHAAEHGCDLEVVSSTSRALPRWDNVSNFAPIASAPLPGYDSLDLVLPPITKMLRHIDRRQPDLVHISTPGPVGLVGLLAGRMLRVPIVGIHHTDFPAYAERIVGDSAGVWVARSLKVFYGLFDAVFVRSRSYIEALTELGVPGERVEMIQPGVDTDVFHPRFRDPSVWERLGAGGREPCVRVLYVGRVSVEKNMPTLVEIWRRTRAACRERGLRAELMIVGDGPYRLQMERLLGPEGVRFLGFRHGEALSTVYASADVFVFPSVTDTLGQVVLEAHASGLATIVTDRGGPAELVEHERTGFVLSPISPSLWADRLVGLIADDAQRTRMGAAAREAALERSARRSFETFWSAHEAVWRRHLATNGIIQLDPATAVHREVNAPDAG
ncbi:MAG: glycosyltransferase [Planctomycetes bacterium]|nr:glycosyltransferase [Planctomycetota bacterium]